MKLKLEMPLKDLAFRFGVSLSTVPRVFFNLDGCFRYQTFTISVWPDRGDMWSTMPQCLRESIFGKT